MDRKDWEDYDKLKEEIMRWGLRKRAEQRQSGHDKMEIDAVKETTGYPEEWLRGEEWASEEEAWWPNEGNEVKWVGKKGKGKGGKKGGQ